MDGGWGISGEAVCHLQCEISSVEVTGALGCTNRALFLRCHVPSGGGRTIQIDSQSAEAHVGDVVSWRDVASLTCDGSAACVRELADTRSVVFEVRRRRRRRRKVMGRAAESVLVSCAEVAWRDVVAVEAGDAAVERRVALAVPSRGGDWTARDDASLATVMSVRMSVRVSETTAPVRRSVGSHRETCGGERSVAEEDVFGVVAFGVADDAGE
ncbi:hypothetical protein ACQ4PT_019882 [Festuca glaucescens]